MLITAIIHGVCAEKAQHAGALAQSLERSLAPFGAFSRDLQTLAISVPLDLVATKDQWLVQIQLRYEVGDHSDFDDEVVCAAVGTAMESLLSGGRVHVTMAYNTTPTILASYLTPAAEAKKPEAQTLVMYHAKDVAEAIQVFAAGKDIVWLPSPIASMRGYHILVSPVHVDYIANLRTMSNLRLVTPPAFKDVKVGEAHVATLYFETSMDPDAAPGLIDEMLLSAANGTHYKVQYA